MEIETYRIVIVCISSITAIGTLIAAIIAVFKLSNISKQIEITNKREIKWKTEATYEIYRSSSMFKKVTESIFEKSKNGTDYTNFEYDHNVLYLINYLESIAVGVEQGIYNEDMMKDYLKEAVYKSVKVFLLGLGGDLKGRSWTANKSVTYPNEQPNLMRLYKKWFPEESNVHYKDPEK